MENNKSRLEATHFVEVWRTKSKIVTGFTNVYPIQKLEEILQETIKTPEEIPPLETILVAKIKFKNNDKK